MKKTMRAISLFLCLSVCLLTVFGCQRNKDPKDENGTFDYLNTDLSSYIEIPEYLYQNLHLDVELDQVTDADVEDAIGNVLYSHRGEEKTVRRQGEVGYGDTVYVWYRGYLKDAETGKETDLYGACNYASPEPTAVTIGAGGYVSGFESALVGAVYGEKPGLQKRASGAEIQEGDTVTVMWSGTKQNLDNTYQGYSTQLIRFVYTEENRAEIESAYGLPAEYKEGLISFYDIVKEIKVGEYYENEAMFEYELGDERRTVWYYDMQVVSATYNESEDNRLAVAEAYFPINYGAEEYNGKTVYFDFYLDGFYNYFEDYEVPALNEDFIHDTLGISDEALTAYDGVDTVSRYRSKVKADLVAAQDLETATFNAMWKLWNDGVNVLRYPEGEIDAFVKEYRDDLDAAIAEAAEEKGVTVEEYKTYYYSEEEFARQYYPGMTSVDTVESYIEQQATDAAKEKLILYALAKITGNVPSEEAWEQAYNDLVDNYLTYYLSDTSEENEYRRELFDTEEAFLAAKEELRGKIIDYYGEAFLRESGFYQYVMEALAKNVASVTYLGRTE